MTNIINALNREIQIQASSHSNMRPFAGAHELTSHLLNKETKRSRKMCETLQVAIKNSGLQDGMTISFHHSFRGGDKTINMVMDVIASMGFKNLTLASSSLSDIHSPVLGHIKQGVVNKIYTSGLRGELAEEISRGLMEEPVQIHSHGGRVHLVETGELSIDVAFIGVSTSDEFGNANAVNGRSRCGSLGYAQVDAQYAKNVIVLTEELVPFPNTPASIAQDQVNFVVQVEEVGDASKIGGDATRMTTNPRELLIARKASEVIENSGYFFDGFTLQTGSGGASLAVTRFLEDKMVKKNITASFGLGGITSTMVKMHEKGLIKTLVDVQSFDSDAADSLARNPNHIEISANQYANPSSKGAVVDRLDVVVLSALEIDTDFNVNVITGSDGVIRGASGGHSDTAASANLTIVVAPLVRGRIPTVVNSVLNVVTPGSQIDVLVTDHGVAVNPKCEDVKHRLVETGVKVFDIEELQQRAEMLTGKSKPIEFLDRTVAYVRYRDGSVIDVIKQIKE